jgi:KaiC/GvpD/RAD55 family RecA-like ATPase
VALRHTLFPELRCELAHGEWIRQDTGARGQNLVELYADFHGRPYRDAVMAIAMKAEILGSDGAVRPLRNLRRWLQEHHPLHRDERAFFNPGYPSSSMMLPYRNATGHAIAQAVRIMRWLDPIDLFRTLWCHGPSRDIQWIEAFPRPPYPLYAADQIFVRREADIIFGTDEFVANELALRFSNYILSAVPGGLKNLPRADLTSLRARRVWVIFRREDLPHGRRIEYALRQAGVEDPRFSVGLDGAPRPFEALEAAAAERGITLLPSPNDEASSNGSAVVIAAGEPIPGGDEVRRILLDPIIGEGYLVWLYAEPQIGKTWLGLAMAYALARGNSIVGRWRTIDPVGVLYVDGEMLPNELEESISMVMAGAGDISGSRPFEVICAQSHDDGLVDILSEKWQQIIEEALKGKKIVILDNFQSLTDNGQAAFEQVRRWVRKLTRKGVAVVVFDHTNREKDLQGNIGKERVANLVIALRYPDKRAKKDGRILVEYPKARRLHGADAEPFQLQKIFTDSTFALREVKLSPGDPRNVRPQVLKMALVKFAREEEGLSFPKIKEKYGIAIATAHGYYKSANTLAGDEKIAFDKERRRLTSELERRSAAHSDEIGR